MGHDHCLPHTGLPLEELLDFAGLDPESADVDLVVGPAEELQFPVLAIARQVPRPVEALAGAEGVGHELLSRQIGPVAIACASPSPPMYNSPATPLGSNCPRGSITYSDVFATGAPSGTARDPAFTLAAEDQTVVSVGPYRFQTSAPRSSS